MEIEEDEVPNCFKCPITKEPMEFPVIAIDGFTYEKSAIEKWISTNMNSPVTGQKLISNILFDNKLIKTMIDKYFYSKLKHDSLKTNLKYSTKISLSPKIMYEKSKINYQEALDHYYRSTMELKKCLEILKKAIDDAPNDYDLLLNYTNMLRFSCQFDEALKFVKKLKKMEPNSLIPKYLKIRIETEMGQKIKAIEKIENILKTHLISDHSLLEIRYLSFSYMSTDFRAAAERLINGYLSQIPNDPRALSHKIYIMLLNEQYEKVIKMCIKYLKSNKNDVSILFHQAKSYNKLNKKDKAIGIYRYIRSFTNDKTVKAKCFYESAMIRDSEKEFDVMVNDLELAHSFDPEIEADGYLAALYTDKKIFEKAERWINECNKRIDINNDSVYLGIKAQILENKCKFPEAVNAYLRLVEIDSENQIYYKQKIEELLNKQTKLSCKNHSKRTLTNQA